MHVCHVCAARKYVHALVTTAEVLRSALTGSESETVKFALKVIAAGYINFVFGLIEFYALIKLFIDLQTIMNGYV